MDVENTDLERRVLAHEQILQVLIAQQATSLRISDATWAPVSATPD